MVWVEIQTYTKIVVVTVVETIVVVKTIVKTIVVVRELLS